MCSVKLFRETPLLIPLLGERARVRGLRIPVPRASTAPSFSALLGTYKGWGEGSSGQPSLGYAKVSPCGDLCTTPPVLEGAAALTPSPGGEGWGEGSSGQPSLGLRKGLLWARVGVRVFRAQCHPSARPAGPRSRLLIPLLGARVGVRGLPGNRPSGYAKVSPCGDLCTTPPVLEGAAALAPSPGGERVGVRGLPGNRPWVTQRSPPEAELLPTLAGVRLAKVPNTVGPAAFQARQLNRRLAGIRCPMAGVCESRWPAGSARPPRSAAARRRQWSPPIEVHARGARYPRHAKAASVGNAKACGSSTSRPSRRGADARWYRCPWRHARAAPGHGGGLANRFSAGSSGSVRLSGDGLDVPPYRTALFVIPD